MENITLISLDHFRVDPNIVRQYSDENQRNFVASVVDDVYVYTGEALIAAALNHTNEANLSLSYASGMRKYLATLSQHQVNGAQQAIDYLDSALNCIEEF